MFFDIIIPIIITQHERRAPSRITLPMLPASLYRPGAIRGKMPAWEDVALGGPRG
jgi:hypothetical protein